jgi:hypothetical protein
MWFLPNISHQSLDTIEFNTFKINSTNSIKLLGIIRDSSFIWKEHTDCMNLKLNPLSCMVRSLRPVLELNILKQLYLSYVHSVLNYGITFWGVIPHIVDLFL